MSVEAKTVDYFEKISFEKGIIKKYLFKPFHATDFFLYSMKLGGIERNGLIGPLLIVHWGKLPLQE